MITMTTVLLLLAAPPAAGDALPSHYYYYDQAVPLELSLEYLAIHEDDPGRMAGTLEALAGRGLASTDRIPWARSRWAFVRAPAGIETGGALKQLHETLVAEGAAAFVSPVFYDAYGPQVVKPEILVGFHRDIPERRAEAILAASGAGTITDRGWGGMPLTYRLRTGAASGFDVLAAANALAERPEVMWAQPGRVFTVRVSDVIPTDPLFQSQWALHNTGQNGGVVDLDMDLPEAWEFEQGTTAVVVAVLDVGVEQTHPDINQITGHDFTGDDVPGGGPGNECDHHGTFVAGVITAVMNNGIGVVGVCPQCLVTSARVAVSNVPCDGAASGDTGDIVDALQWVQDLNYDVTNSSLAFPFDSAVAQKYTDTRAAGVVHFAATGNEGVGTISFPSSVAAVHAVTGIDRFGNHFGNFGTGVAFTAGAAEIASTDRTGAAGYDPGDYHTGGGTSIASPLAAGVGALVLSLDSAMTPDELDFFLQTTVTDLGQSGYDTLWGWGMLNAHDAVLAQVVDVCGSNLESCYAVNQLSGGCDDPNCCLKVCDASPLCCWVGWDALCAELAVELCSACGDFGSGDCFSANGTPACEQFGCCEIVCLLDPYCCDTAWDALCANEAASNCPPVNDACADATPVSAGGAYDFDTSVATMDGPDHATCLNAGQSGIDRDVWYCFTAPETGLVDLWTCAQTTVDTKVAVYAECGVCPPTDGQLLACNDDSCGLQSEVSFATVAGQQYLIRVGVYPGAAGGTGTFFLEYPHLGANNCTASTDIAGEGDFAFENAGATMDGPDHAACLNAGESGIDKDVWFCWTAPGSGTATVSTCGRTSVDTKIAAYVDCIICPPLESQLLACNDDFCGLQTQIQFDVIAGVPYLIRIGVYPGAAGGAGVFQVTVAGDCPWDCGDGDGVVGIVDLLALLSQWGTAGPCDTDGGGAGITDFLDMLAHWGPCS